MDSIPIASHLEDAEAFGLRVQPTEEEVQLGYYYAEGFSRGGQELGFAVLTGGASRASTVGQAAMILDTAGNINGVKRNGDQGNYLAAAGHGAGLTGNFGALQRVRLDKFRVVPLDEVVGTRRLPTRPQVDGVPSLPRNPASAPISTSTRPGTYVFVRDADGVVHVVPDGPGLHPTVLGNGQAASAAGEITIGPNGVVTEINNISFTFQFGSDVLPSVRDALRRLGLNVADDAIKPFTH